MSKCTQWSHWPPPFPSFHISASTCTPCHLWPPIPTFDSLYLCQPLIPCSLSLWHLIPSLFTKAAPITLVHGLQPFPTFPISLSTPYSMLSLALNSSPLSVCRCQTLLHALSSLQLFPSLLLLESNFTPCSLWPLILPLSPYIGVHLYSMLSLASNSSPVSLYLPNPSSMLSLASNPFVFPYISVNIYSMLSLASTLPLFPYICVNLYSMLSLASNSSPLSVYWCQLLLHALSGLQLFPSLRILVSTFTLCSPWPQQPFPTLPLFASTFTPCFMATNPSPSLPLHYRRQPLTQCSPLASSNLLPSQIFSILSLLAISERNKQ